MLSLLILLSCFGFINLSNNIHATKKTRASMDTYFNWPDATWEAVTGRNGIPLAEHSWTDLILSPSLFTHFLLQYWCFIPEFVVLVFIIGVALKRNLNMKKMLKYTLVVFQLVSIFYLVVYMILPPFVRYFLSHLYFVDNYVFLVKFIIFLVFQFFLLIVYHRFFDKRPETIVVDPFHYKVVYIISLSFLFFSFVFVSISDFFGFYVILEGLSFAFIFLCTLNFNKSVHLLASIRYFVYNIFASGGLLLGIAILYGLLGTTNFFYCNSLLSLPDVGFSEECAADWFVLAPKSLVLFTVLFFFGCFFKLGCFPFNTWLLNVNIFLGYETFFIMNIIFKNLFFFVFFRICTFYLAPLANFWSPLLLFIGFCSIVTGTLGAFGIKRIKGFFTFSSIAQMGYNLVGMAFLTVNSYASVFFLHLVYLFSSLVIIGTILYLSCDSLTLKSSKWRVRNIFYVLSDLHLLRKIQPLLAVAVTFAILSMAGLPPTLGFFAKYYYYQILINCNMFQLCIVLIILNGFSLYYYINVLKNLWLFDSMESINLSYSPRFTYEAFMVIILSFFVAINSLAFVLQKIFLLFATKMSWYGSRLVFAQTLHYWFLRNPYFSAQFEKTLTILTSSEYKDSLLCDDYRRNLHFGDRFFMNAEADLSNVPADILNDAATREFLISNSYDQHVWPVFFTEVFNISDPEWVGYTIFMHRDVKSYFFWLLFCIIWSFLMLFVWGFNRAMIITPPEYSVHLYRRYKKYIISPFTHPNLLIGKIKQKYLGYSMIVRGYVFMFWEYCKTKWQKVEAFYEKYRDIIEFHLDLWIWGFMWVWTFWSIYIVWIID